VLFACQGLTPLKGLRPPRALQDWRSRQLVLEGTPRCVSHAHDETSTFIRNRKPCETETRCVTTHLPAFAPGCLQGSALLSRSG